jgi:hypothetical protein
MLSSPRANLSDPAKPDTDNRLSDFARRLAKTHAVDAVPLPVRNSAGISRRPRPDLLEQMEIWEKALRSANAIFKAVPSNDLPVSRAGEWMLDNFYVVKQTFRQIEENLPASFLNQLPKLAGTPLRGSPGSGTGQGYPRIFALAWEWIGYSQSQLDLTQVTAFVQDYQQVTPLTIGELWALPTMLRIGILERLVYAAVELTGMDMPRGLSEIPGQFASPALANETIVANCFLSLRLLSTANWEAFFEQTSRVEQILRDDPAGIYTRMDFDTRNSYRSVVEELARYSTSRARRSRTHSQHGGKGLRAANACRLLSTGCGAFDARNQRPLPAWIKHPYPPRDARSPHCYLSGEYCHPHCTVCFGIADVRHTFGRLAYPMYHCRRTWDWIGF